MMRAALLGIVLSASAAYAGDEKMHFDVGHSWSKAVAHERAQYLFDYWKQAFGVQTTWEGDRAVVAGRVMGIQINAVLVVTDTSIGGDGEDPGPFMRGIARSYIT